MRKIIKLSIVALLTIIGSVLVSIAVTACGSTTVHTHDLTHYSAMEPTCNADGRIEYWRCYGCNKVFSDADGINEITNIRLYALGHSYSEEWNNNNTYHWHDAICEHTNLTEDKQIHKFENNICSVCKYEANFTTGLELYELKSGENEGKYTVKGLGTATDTNLVIPATYDGKEIVSIAGGAFRGSNIKEVTIPKSIISIGSDAFGDCVGLEKVDYLGDIEDWCKIDFDWWRANPLIYAHNLYIQDKLVEDLVIPSSITAIESAFKGANIKSVIIPDSVISVSAGAFSGCNSIKKASVPALAIESIINPSLEELTITSGEIGKEVLESYNQDKCQNLKVVTIGNNVKSIGERAFMGCKNLGRLTIENGLTSIGYEAFSYCSSLISINLPNSVTTIGSRAFQYCDSIVEFKLGTGIQTIGELAFFSCDSLERISVESENETYSSQDGVLYNKSQTEFILVPNKIKGAVTIPDAINAIEKGTFSGRNELTEVVMGDNVKSIGVNAFYNCAKLRKVNLGDGVVSIGSAAFEYCYNLYQLNLGNSLKTIEKYAFDGCSNLFSVTLPESLETIGTYAFAECHKLVEIYNKSNLSITKDIINNGNAGYGYQVLNIYTPQSGQSKLTETDDGFILYEDNSNRYLVTYLGDNKELILPDYINGYRYSLYDFAFSHSSIESITLPSTLTSTGKYVCYECNNLKYVIIPSNIDSIGEMAFYGCRSLENIDLSDGVKWIGNYAFWKCNSLEIIELPDSVISIGNYAFEYCGGLTNITIPDSVTSIGHGAFEYCGGLTNVIIGNSVTSIGNWVFEYCSGLTSINIPDSVTRIGSSAFSGCINLIQTENGVQYVDKWIIACDKEITEVTLRNNTKGIVDSAFSGCSGLISIAIPDSLKSIGSSAFYGCSSLETVYWNATACTSNGSIFGNCTNLSTVIIRDNVTAIPAYAFYGCTLITSITLPDSVTSIGNDAFNMCTSLASVTISNSVISINSLAFFNCSSLENVYYKGTEEDWAEISISSNNTKLTSATRYYYSETEPALNAEGTAYDGNYWHYDTEGVTAVIWQV